MKDSEIKSLYNDLKTLEQKYSINLVSQPTPESFKLSSSIFILPHLSESTSSPFDVKKFSNCIKKGTLFKSRLDFFTKLNQISYAWYRLQKFDPKGIMTDFVAVNGLQIDKDGLFRVPPVSAYGDKRYSNLLSLSQGPLKKSTVSGILSVSSKKGYILKNEVINPGDLKKFFSESHKIPSISKLVMMTYILRYLDATELNTSFNLKSILKGDKTQAYYVVNHDAKSKYLSLPGDDYID